MVRGLLMAAAVGLAVAGPAGAAPEVKEKSAERIRDLQQQRVKALKTQLDDQLDRVLLGKDPVFVFVAAVQDLAEAEADLAEAPEARVAALEGAVDRLKDAEAKMSTLLQRGLQTKSGVAQVTAARLKAEIQLEKRRPGR
jgi:hypothetical protein